MKQLTALNTFVLLLILNICNGQVQQEKRPISEFEFESIFGYSLSDPYNIYSLLGTGYFRAPRSSNSDSLVAAWIESHPKAMVIPVSSQEKTGDNTSDTNFVYCWVIDESDTLNNYLVKNGCFHGSTMMRPQTYEEMEDWVKNLYTDSEKRPDVKVFVDKNSYNKFLEQVQASEQYARKNQLGIWSEDLE